MTLEQAYREYRAMLFGVLARLARLGLTAPPYESLDLIHSFFVDEWASVMRNYRPERGALRAYIYGAFVRYARRVMLREQRLRGGLLDESTLASYMESDRSESTAPETGFDLDRIRSAMEVLPEFEREVLVEYLNGASERELAARLQVSRYRIRASLAVALARVAMQLERPAFIDQRKWKVMQLMLEGGRTVKQTAAWLGESEQWVQSVHRTNLRTLLARLRMVSTNR